jgi:hypothetical protein
MPGVEVMEPRALLASGSTSFQAPDLTSLIQEAYKGVNTAPEAIKEMVQALETQLTSGPLADLQAGTVDGSGFIGEVASLVASYQSDVSGALSARFPNVANLMELQGTRIQADLNALSQEANVGLITNDQLATSAATAISDLTGGSLQALGTHYSAYKARTQTFESDLNTLAQSLSSGATTPLSITDVNTTLNAEAEAYRADMAGSLYLHPKVNQLVDNAITTLETQSNSIAQSNPSDAQTELENAIAAFDTAVLDTTGVFGPQGVVGRRFSSGD